MLRKKPLIIFTVIGAALSGALIRMAFTAFEGTSTNSKKATWEHFCASFGSGSPLPYHIVLKAEGEGENLKAEGTDDGEVLETLKRLSPRLATEEEIEAAALIPDDGYGRDLWFGTCDRSNPDGYKELTLTINDTNIATVEWVDEHYWNSLFRNRYWLEAEEIDCLVDVVVKVARAASCEGSESSNAIDMPRVQPSMGQSPIEKRSFWQDAKIHDIGTTIFPTLRAEEMISSLERILP